MVSMISGNIVFLEIKKLCQVIFFLEAMSSDLRISWCLHQWDGFSGWI